MKKLCFVFVALMICVSSYAADVQRVACVGDSITFGARIKDREQNCYPTQLGKLLGAGYEVRNFGVSGATLLKKGNKPYWILGAYKKALAFNPDIVVIKLGTNDTKPENWKHESEYISNCVELVNSFKSLDAKPQVFICKPVPVYETKGGINDKSVVEGVIPKLSEVSKQTDVAIIDLYKPLSNQEALFPDKIHPNKDGAAIIAATVSRIILDNAGEATAVNSSPR